jgi:hypothetical protein
MTNHMKIHIKPLIALASGPVLIAALFCQTAQAQQVVENPGPPLAPGGSISGVTTMADTGAPGIPAVNTGPEALTVDWSVAEPLPGTYIYSYDVFNPLNDVILTGPAAGNPETIAGFSITFPNGPGAIISPILGGTVGTPNPDGVSWLLISPAIAPGTDSTTDYGGVAMSFASALPPSDGNANAHDSSVPSPWDSSPYGGYFPVPGVGDFSVPPGGFFAPPIPAAPDATSTFALLSGMMLLLPFRSTIKRVIKK